MNTPLLLACLLTSLVFTARARTIESVEVPEEKTVEETKLVLNGAGVRTVQFTVIPIKAYVAAFYAPTPLATAREVMDSKGPMEFNFTFLRGVGQADVTRAWNSQFAESVSASYPGLEKDQAAFVKMFGPLDEGGVEKVVIVGDETKVYDGGAFKGAVKGREFQQAFLSLWFGSKPVMESLKSELLGN